MVLMLLFFVGCVVVINELYENMVTKHEKILI